MNRKYRLSIAVLLAVVLVLTAAGAWAAPKFQGTVPEPPQEGEGDSDTPIVLAGVKITTNCVSCSFTTSIAARTNLPVPPSGKEFIGNAISLNIHGDGLANLCFPYTPDAANKNARIYKLDHSVSPAAWVVFSSNVNADGTICAPFAGDGVYVLMGDS